MSKTAEEIYEERLDQAVRGIITEYLESGVDYLSVSEYLEDGGYDPDDDFVEDVHETIGNELDELLQRYLDY